MINKEKEKTLAIKHILIAHKAVEKLDFFFYRALKEDSQKITVRLHGYVLTHLFYWTGAVFGI